MSADAVSILCQIFLAFGIALAGGALSATFARTHKQLCAFISLGAGTLLGVALCGIAPECWDDLKWWFLPAAASGYLLFAIITKYVYHVCPACAASHFDEATTHRLAEFATAMMFALGIHCTVDGLALAAGLEESSEAIKLSIVFAICVHKFPEGLALGALLLGGGGGGHDHRRRFARLVCPAKRPALRAGVDTGDHAGQRLRRIFVSGHPRGARRNTQTSQGAGAWIFRGGFCLDCRLDTLFPHFGLKT